MMLKKTRFYFYLCPECGAALDPGEKCECQEQPHSLQRPKEPARIPHREQLQAVSK